MFPLTPSNKKTPFTTQFGHQVIPTHLQPTHDVKWLRDKAAGSYGDLEHILITKFNLIYVSSSKTRRHQNQQK